MVAPHYSLFIVLLNPIILYSPYCRTPFFYILHDVEPHNFLFFVFSNLIIFLFICIVAPHYFLFIVLFNPIIFYSLCCRYPLFAIYCFVAPFFLYSPYNHTPLLSTCCCPNSNILYSSQMNRSPN